ncbi:thioredoxin family protein [Flavobacterium sangjuense]|uniref:Disulfide bond reductase DsbH n=1 Tax=Flavobacterium sangjuense TaxID=2518177 RepID=A0A4P7PVR9_9FLAO|nr:thioredoxin family protein [Flavobacterium sangjuense]QBZ99109.1 Disulfide bond reductase DsbH [Flavobacterium sangjuense]
MKRILTLFLLCVSICTYSQEANTLQNSFSKAKQEHKKVLFFFSGSDWCSPCVKFKRSYIDSEAFKDFSASNLIVFNADFPRQKKNALSKEQTSENEKLAEKYNPNGLFPLIILFDENGKIIRKWEELPQETVAEFISNLK